MTKIFCVRLPIVLLAALISSASIAAPPKSIPMARSESFKPTSPSAAKQAFNRNSIGGASRVSPGMRDRAHKIADGLKRPGGARSMGLKSQTYRNDGKGGSVILPKTKNGKQVTYESTYMRPGGHKRKLSNGRVTTGSDGSIYVSRHHGQGGGKVARIQ